MTTHVARGTRGDWAGARPGDLTGKQYLASQQQKTGRLEAVNFTINELRDNPNIVIVPIKGGASYAVPRAAYEAIVAATKRGVEL